MTQTVSTLRSMTAFASGRGDASGFDWTWELRSVNGKGLDLRLRVPDWISGLEVGLRARLGAVLARGNVTLSLRVQAEDAGGRLTVNAAQLDAALDAVAEVEARAMARGEIPETRGFRRLRECGKKNNKSGARSTRGERDVASARSRKRLAPWRPGRSWSSW